jgi:hypothetical protein
MFFLNYTETTQAPEPEYVIENFPPNMIYNNSPFPNINKEWPSDTIFVIPAGTDIKDRGYGAFLELITRPKGLLKQSSSPTSFGTTDWNYDETGRATNLHARYGSVKGDREIDYKIYIDQGRLSMSTNNFEAERKIKIDALPTLEDRETSGVLVLQGWESIFCTFTKFQMQTNVTPRLSSIWSLGRWAEEMSGGSVGYNRFVDDCPELQIVEDQQGGAFCKTLQFVENV